MRRTRDMIRRSITVVTSVAFLASCGPGGLGFDDGSDTCRPQQEALNNTGNFFAQNILAGAAVGAVTGAALGALGAAVFGGRSRDIGVAALIGGGVGAVAGGVGGYWQERQRQANNDAVLAQRAVASDLAKENQELDRTQLAFNQLMDCRFAQRNRIFADYRAGRLTRDRANGDLQTLRGRIEQDIAIAQRINQNVGRRGAEFDVAIQNVAPGSQRTASRPEPRSYTTSQALVLRSSPNSAAPEVAQVAPRQAVTVRPAQGQYALVETAEGQRGYVPAASVGTRGLGDPSAGRGGDVRQLAATNIYSRESFGESIENAQRMAAAPSGFQVAS